MTYNVFGGTLNLAQLNSLNLLFLCFLQELLNSLYFKDGKRRIDFVLVVRPNSDGEEYRETFERNLEQDGLELEYEAAFVLHNSVIHRFVAKFVVKVSFCIHFCLTMHI